MVYGTSSVHGGDDKRLTYGGKAGRHSTQLKNRLRELRHMSIEELQELSLQKAPNGCATELAIEAQKMIYKKRNWGY